MNEIAKELKKIIETIAITGRLEYHKFPPPEYFANELTYYINNLIIQVKIDILKQNIKTISEILYIKNADSEAKNSMIRGCVNKWKDEISELEKKEIKK